MSGRGASIDDIVRKRRLDNWFQEEPSHGGEPDLRPDSGRIFVPRTIRMDELERQFRGHVLFATIHGN